MTIGNLVGSFAFHIVTFQSCMASDKSLSTIVKSFNHVDQEKNKTKLGNSIMIEPQVKQENIMHRKVMINYSLMHCLVPSNLL